VIECLSQAEHTRLQKLRVADPFVDESIRQLERILTGHRFAQVQRRAKDFLTLVVIKELLGKGHEIKEMTIAISVFRESATYDPMTSSKVRVAAADLRRRLAAYYADEGRNDPIEIVIPISRYVPEIRDRRITLAVSTFENWHPAGDQSHLCLTLADDIVYLLSRSQRVTAIRTTNVEPTAGVAKYCLRGSLEPRPSTLRLNVSLADVSAARILYCRTFKSRRRDAFRLTRTVANALLRTLSRRRGGGGMKEKGRANGRNLEAQQTGTFFGAKPRACSLLRKRDSRVHTM